MFKIILVSVLLLANSCSVFKDSNYKRPLLRKAERELYVINYGWDMSTENRLAFVEGKIIPGMKTEYILQIYGEPDLSLPCPKRQNICDGIWQYGTNDTVIVGGVLIKNSVVISVTGQLKKPCKF